MKLPIKKIWVVISAILLLLIFLNPGIGRFKEYSGLTSKDSHFIKRTYNFLIFSIYEDTYNDKKYMGVLLNFINITPKKPSFKPDTTTTTSEMVDTNEDGLPIIKKIPSFEEVMIGSVYKTKDGRTYAKRQLLNSGYSEDRIRTGIYNGVLIPINSEQFSIEPKLKLWDILVESNLYTGSYEEFKKKYSASDSVNFLFNGVKEDKLYTKSRDEFYKQYFPELIDPPFPKGFTPDHKKDSIK